MNIEKIIDGIRNADEIEIMEYDFDECFTALREMRYLLDQIEGLGMLTEGHDSGASHKAVCKQYAKFNAK